MKTSLLACKVLLVEDMPEARRLMRQLMRRLGVTLIEAADGFEGIRLAREELPDLILMDLNLPIVDGWEATRTLKADPVTAGIPIVIVTAHAMWDEARRVQEVGCDGYVMKPLDPLTFGRDLSAFLLVGAPAAWATGR